MDIKAKTVKKSKSSNSASFTRSNTSRKSKKSRTNAEFQPLYVKRRGVYVENKATKSLDVQGTDSSQNEKRSPPPPRPGKKCFLTSVLSILSKSTTGTEYPPGYHITEAKKDKTNINSEEETKTIEKLESFETDSTTISVKMSSTEELRSRIRDKKKNKYRSKILNDYNADKLEVLQSNRTHNLSNSPSNCSDVDREEISWIGFPKLVQNDAEHRNVNDLVKQISEGRQPKEKVKSLETEPATLVSEHKDDKKLYNFFVDILETTFSVYNVKSEFEKTPSAASSKLALEIDESVAKKLRFKNVENQEIFHDDIQEPSKLYYTIKDSQADKIGEIIPDNIETKQTKRREHKNRSTSPQNKELHSRSPQRRFEARSRSPKKRLKSESFSYPRKILPPSRSTDIAQCKSLYKKNKKRDLLNMFREQLKMDHYYCYEPRNIYDALKIMAKNKRKCEKTLRIAMNKKIPDTIPDECTIKRRKIVTPSLSFKQTKPVSKRHSELSKIRRNTIKNDESTDCELSNHSIEVYGFDYDVPAKKKYMEPKLQQYLLTYHSSDSDFEDRSY